MASSGLSERLTPFALTPQCFCSLLRSAQAGRGIRLKLAWIMLLWNSRLISINSQTYECIMHPLILLRYRLNPFQPAHFALNPLMSCPHFRAWYYSQPRAVRCVAIARASSSLSFVMNSNVRYCGFMRSTKPRTAGLENGWCWSRENAWVKF